MRVKTFKTSDGEVHYAIIKDIRRDGKRTSTVVEHLGTSHTLSARYPGKSPLLIAQKRAALLTAIYHQEAHTLIPMDQQPRAIVGDTVKQIGYLFLDWSFYQGTYDSYLQKIFQYHRQRDCMINITRTLCETLLLSPTSLHRAYITVQNFLEPPTFSIQMIYRTLQLLGKNADKLSVSEITDPNKPYFEHPPYLTNPIHIHGYHLLANLALHILDDLQKRAQIADVLPTLRTMQWYEVDDGYRPCYIRTTLTDRLHACVGFRTDYQRITYQQFKKVLRLTKSSKK